jgi:Uma2 family endonuclease
MGETPIHRQWMIYIDNVLERRYSGQRFSGQGVYLGSDMLVYYVEGDPRKYLVPDNFVAFGCQPGYRRVYKTWEDPPPSVVFEVSSNSTKTKDQTVKPETYIRVGVREIILFDPLGEMQPALQGIRIVDKKLVKIEPDKRGAIESQELDVLLWLEEGNLVLAECASGERLLSDRDVLAAKEAELEAKEAEIEAKEAEIRKLREALKAREGDSHV